MKKTHLRILLIGYGKMGRTIEMLAKERGHEVVAAISDRQMDLSHICKAYQPNIAFEFTSPSSAPGNLKLLLEAGIPIVCGSTGWLDNWKEVEALVHSAGGSLFYASNYSLGMNLMFKWAEVAGQFLNSLPEYEVDIEEIHHTEKRDIPSGTAITLAEILLAQLSRKTNWELSPNPAKDAIGITAIREPDVPGTHTVTFTSVVDTLQMTHTAHSRNGFALGAIRAGEWLMGKKGVFSMEDFLEDQFAPLPKKA